MSTARGLKITEKRLKERQRIFGDCESIVWSRDAKGFTSIPRILPLIFHLLNFGAEKAKGNPENVYLELWARSFEGGFIKIDDEEGAAFSAGYTGARAIRSWREHMAFLNEQGFIYVKPNGNKPFGYVLIVNPLIVAATKITQGRVDESWIHAFVARCGEVGTVIPQVLENALSERNKSKEHG